MPRRFESCSDFLNSAVPQECRRIEDYFAREEEIAPESNAQRLYVCVDAAKAHTDGAWHDVKAAVVFAGEIPAVDSDREIDEMTGARYLAAQESSEEFGKRLYVQAALS